MSQHRYYVEVEGKRIRVPRVTTVTGTIDLGRSSALMRWAADLGREGIYAPDFRDEKAAVGTCAHAMAEAFVTGACFDAEPYPDDIVEQAKVALGSFYDWMDVVTFTPILTEAELVSPTLMVGGRIDLYGYLDGALTLVDLKTSKHLKFDHAVQVAGYALLLVENNHPVERVIIVRIGREDNEGFEVRDITPDLSTYEEAFACARQMYAAGTEAKKAWEKGEA